MSIYLLRISNVMITVRYTKPGWILITYSKIYNVSIESFNYPKPLYSQRGLVGKARNNNLVLFGQFMLHSSTFLMCHFQYFQQTTENKWSFINDADCWIQTWCSLVSDTAFYPNCATTTCSCQCLLNGIKSEFVFGFGIYF